MARATLSPNGAILSISGKLGDVIFRKTPSGRLSVARVGKRNYEKHPVTANESLQRQRFGQSIQISREMLANEEYIKFYENLRDETPRKGQKSTLRAFIVSCICKDIFPPTYEG